MGSLDIDTLSDDIDTNQLSVSLATIEGARHSCFHHTHKMEAAQETFEFPRDITLDEARQAIKGCFEFKEKEENGLIFIDYRFSSKNTFPDPNSAPDTVKKRLLAIRRYVHCNYRVCAFLTIDI